MKCSFAGIFSLAAFCGAIAQAAPAPISNEFAGHSILELKTFIGANGITDLSDLLPRLSKMQRSNFVLMRQSASLQPNNDPQQPRAILFGEDAKFIVAFNGSGSSIEMIESADGDFKFARFDFTPQGVKFPAINCNGCHQGRPLWGQYRSWLGMYGGDQEMVPSGSAEERDYLTFVKNAASHPLYKNLIFKCGDYYNGGIHPGYVPRSGATACTEVADLLKGLSSPERLSRRYYQQAEGFGELLNRLNASSLFARAKLSPRYTELNYAYAANLLGCFGDRVYNYNADESAVKAIRSALGPQVSKLETRFGGQEKMLTALGLNLRRQVRMDIRAKGDSFLGNDCEVHRDYSPNDDCPGGDGYPGYSDGTDMGPDLIGYLILRDIYVADPAAHAAILAGLEKTRDYFSDHPTEYAADSIQRYLPPVLKDLDTPSTDPIAIPKYMLDYPLGHLMRRGDGLAVCRALIHGIR